MIQSLAVLIVDDDASICRSLERSLRGAGYSVHCHLSVHDCLANEHANSAACVILDIDIGSDNGIELLLELRRRNMTAPAIFMSANDLDGTELARINEVGARLLAKPFEVEELIRLLNQVVGD